MLKKLVWKSVVSRKKTVLLTFLSLLVSISLLVSVEHLRSQIKESFNRTISGTDLIVGAPTGELNLLLYSVFRMGSPTNNIQYDSLLMLQKHRSVAWTIPLSLGDSHKGFRVLGTTNDYFDHFKYGNKQNIAFAEGDKFSTLFDVVLGAEVAESLGYRLGDDIVVSHGIGNTSFHKHDHSPFHVTGILKPTGTPVDRTLHVSLQAIEAIHLAPRALDGIIASENYNELEPANLTAVLVGLKSKLATFTLQRQVNQYKNDRLMAVLPGVALNQLWQLMASMEKLLQFISALVLLASLFGLTTMLLASMNERSVEIAVMRILGASPRFVLLLILSEAVFIVLLASVSACVLVSGALVGLSDWLSKTYGLFLSTNLMSQEQLILLLLVLLSAIFSAIFPAIEAYRKALHSQLST